MTERIKTFLTSRYSYDPVTGVITSNRTGKPVGSPDKDGYLRVSYSKAGGKFSAHRFAFLAMTGDWPNDLVDHINGDPSDNRWENIRACNQSLNKQNLRKATAQNKSCGLLGVTFDKSSGHKKPWKAVIRITIGRFDTAEEAHAAYLNAKRQLHVGCSI